MTHLSGKLILPIWQLSVIKVRLDRPRIRTQATSLGLTGRSRSTYSICDLHSVWGSNPVPQTSKSWLTCLSKDCRRCLGDRLVRLACSGGLFRARWIRESPHDKSIRCAEWCFLMNTCAGWAALVWMAVRQQFGPTRRISRIRKLHQHHGKFGMTSNIFT